MCPCEIILLIYFNNVLNLGASVAVETYGCWGTEAKQHLV